mgnify:CR=1 FL=1
MTVDPFQRQARQRVSVAPSPATSGVAFSIDNVTDYHFGPLSQSVPFKAKSLDRRREMARQICDAITEKAGGNALEWIQRANSDQSIIPFDSEEEAMAMIVRGFIEPIARELPMEYALELNRLIELQMEGAVG